MAMIISRRAVVAGLAAMPLVGAAQAYGDVTVFEARRIVTMEAAPSAARFVAVAEGIVLALGPTLESLAAWTRGRRVTVDRRFAGKVLFPGLIDPHIHPMQAAVMLNLPFLAPDDWVLPSGRWPGVQGQDAYRARLAALVHASNADPMIVWGWHELFHGPLDRAVLDSIAPDRALVVWQRSFHEVVANTAMLRVWGLDRPDPFAAALAGVHADPGHADLAAGVFSETALAVALAKLRPAILSPTALAKGFADLKAMMLARGVTTASDMATGIFADFDTEAALIQRAFGAPDTAARIMLMPMAARLDAVTDLDGWLADARRHYCGPRVRLDRRVKLFADGAFFAQAMRMNAPGYSDGHLGKWLTEPDVLHGQMRRYWAAGFAFHIHVNGDEGLDVVLDGLATLEPRRAQTITLEHLGYATEAQVRRIARMGLMVSAQPNYIRVLGEAYAAQGLGAGRGDALNRLGSLDRAGVPLGLHSDFNIAPIDPFYLAWIAATRLSLSGRVQSPEERLPVAAALRAVTVGAAHVIGMDAQVGSIAPGKRADMIALHDDPHTQPAMALKDLPIDGVVFEGRVVRG